MFFKEAILSVVPHLSAVDGYHQLRNDARKKMSRLPTERFYWLVGDVYFGVAMRYPELKEDGNRLK